MNYISAAQAASKWKISKKRVTVLCKDGRVSGAQMAGNVWIIPETAEKPADARVKSGRYIKEAKTK